MYLDDELDEMASRTSLSVKRDQVEVLRPSRRHHAMWEMAESGVRDFDVGEVDTTRWASYTWYPYGRKD